MSLRKCYVCGLEAQSIESLELFSIAKDCLYGRQNICKVCLSTRYAKGGKYYKKTKIYQNKIDKKRLFFDGKTLRLDKNPRTNICSKCGKKYPEELIKQTHLHHIKYDKDNPLAYTIELCTSCHAKIHGLGIKNK